MKILAIDSSSIVATVAIIDNNTIIAEYSVNHKKTHSQTLLPMIDEIVKMSETNLNDIDAIAVSGGPGSFTGLRIGSATAKGLGLALKKPLIHIPTMDGLAYNMYGTDKMVCPMMDARRNQVYTGLYHFENDELLCDLNQCQSDIHELINKINENNQPVVFLGDGAKTYESIIKEETKVSFQFAPPHLLMQNAASYAALGVKYFEKGKIETAMEHQPDYLRKSQAERELEEKMKNKNE
jgi:tRNA threonylcarbamoyladenosine biosynthesis protein TsaB